MIDTREAPGWSQRASASATSVDLNRSARINMCIVTISEMTGQQRKTKEIDQME